jgi:anti-anti-sigma factor
MIPVPIDEFDWILMGGCTGMKLMAIGESAGILTLDKILSDEREKDLINLLTEVFGKKWVTLVIDFNPLDYFTSSGAAALVKMSVLAKKHGIKLIASGLRQRYQEIFNITSLNEGFTIIRDKNELSSYLLRLNAKQIDDLFSGTGKQIDTGWSPNIFWLHVKEKPEGSMNKNVDKRRVIGPLQGFGQMWEKTYLLKIEKPDLQPYDVMDVMKQHFPEFQPSQNAFYPSKKGITPGEIVLIDSKTPGGIVSTGVLVLYADELSFSLITPQGHPASGWVTFLARKYPGGVEMQIQGLERASDPFFELAYRVAGSKLQETIWKHVLSSLASHLGIRADVTVVKNCLASDFQWARIKNLWFNSQIRSLPYNIQLIGKPRKK